MPDTQSRTETSLTLTRWFKAPREKVFRAWTEAETLKRWFAPSDAFTVLSVLVDLRVGGKYRIEVRSPDGQMHCLGGSYKEIAPPERLVFTWAWETAEQPNEMLVTVEFRERDGGTELRLLHEFFRDQEQRDRHAHGWSGILDRLPNVL